MRRCLPLAVILLLILAAGCGSNIPVNSASSPLGNGGGGLGECIPSPYAGPVTYGVNEAYNTSDAPVTVEQVSLYGAHHLQVVRAVSVPVGDNAIGVGPWPPVHPSLTQSGVRWAERVPAAGSTVPPLHGHGLDYATGHDLVRNIVFELHPTARRSIAAGELVRYRQGSHQYEWREHDEITVIIGSC